MQPIVSMTNVTKAFGPNIAVNAVSLEILPGTVRALMGENGAGKSTLMKVLAGVHQPDTGTIAIKGVDQSFANPKQALAAGVSTVFQELSLLPNLTIAENMFLGREIIGRLGVPNRPSMEDATRAALAELGLTIDPGTLVSELSIAERQFVEIAHGIKADADVFVLDEPTAALNAADVEVLNAQIRRLKATGKAVIYISHRMDEIFNICDDVTVMKDGQHVATTTLDTLTPDALIALMVGRELRDLFPDRSPSSGVVRLKCQDLLISATATPVSFDLHAGEILGLAGLEGQGQQDIARSMIGQHAAISGTLTIGVHSISMPVSSSSGVRDMQELKLGFVPEDRKEEGLLLGASISENIGISLQAARSAYQTVTQFKELVARTMRDMDVKAKSPAANVGSLSGGNQQKVLLGRYLASDMDILIIEEPTRGVDIGAKAEIYKLLRALADDGKAIIVLSRETVELIGLCDRLLVVHDQAVVREMEGDAATEHAILDVALNP